MPIGLTPSTGLRRRPATPECNTFGVGTQHRVSALEFTDAAAYVAQTHRRSENSAVMARTNPLQFIQQVRAEVAKVVWPTRREVFLTTVMVFIMATLTAIFFALVDILIRSGLEGLLGLF